MVTAQLQSPSMHEGSLIQRKEQTSTSSVSNINHLVSCPPEEKQCWMDGKEKGLG
jgi:hypothetical protein